MSTFIEITPDPFASSFRGRLAADQLEDLSKPGTARAGAHKSFDHVRRPVRGIQIKDETYATIQVHTPDGRNIPLVDSGGSIYDTRNPNVAYSENYSNFLMQSVSEQRAEKMQIIQTFGEPYVFFFGEQPRMIAVSGILLNTEDFNWRAEFWENYDQYLRGTKCVQSMTRAILSWDDIVVEGYFIKADASEDASNNNVVKVSFQILLTNYANVSQIGNANFPKTTSASVNLNPYTLDVDPTTTGGLESVTEAVRSLSSQGFTGHNSLLQSLRNGIRNTVDLDGSPTPFLDLASQFVYSRNVRVPWGYFGDSVYDQETQIALASVSAQDRNIILSKTAKSSFNDSLEVPGRTRRTTPAAAYFGKFSDNWDEYVTTYVTLTQGPFSPPDLFSGQKVPVADILTKTGHLLDGYGLYETSAPDESIQLAKNSEFGLMPIPAPVPQSDILE